MDRILIKGGTIVTMDPAVPDLAQGDVLIEGDRIAAVAPAIAADNARVIDARERIVMPGFVNAHIHTWQTALRGVAADWAAPEYLHNMHANFAPAFRPTDIYISNFMGALNQLNSGVTTIVDWCHNNPSPAHSDAAIDALFEAGIRAVFMHGSAKPDPKPGQKHFSEIPQPRSEIERFARGRFAAKDALVTLGLAILGPHYSTYEVARADFNLAREFDLLCSMHVGGGAPQTPEGFPRLAAEGLIGANSNIVHGNNLTMEMLRLLVDAGGTVTVTPECEMQMGFGHPVTGKLRALGSLPSIGSDVESGTGSDMFTNMRMALQYQRALDNQVVVDRTGVAPEHLTVTAREALEWATINGARMAKLDRVTGSLTPGKQADIVLLRADDLNIFPVTDPVHAIVLHGSAANVDTVFVAGRAVKEVGKLAHGDLVGRRAALAATSQRVMAQAAGIH
ncbi:MAG TPA: amidohydrolase family protein [Stellaceae bacterium]|nr:amidohydrolase family protein [Stellaceae bacterium]